MLLVNTLEMGALSLKSLMVPCFLENKSELLKVHLESSEEVIILSLPDPLLVRKSAPIKNLDHGSTLRVDDKQTALFFFFKFGFISSVKGICAALCGGSAH